MKTFLGLSMPWPCIVRVFFAHSVVDIHFLPQGVWTSVKLGWLVFNTTLKMIWIKTSKSPIIVS
jgi:hypothetical protein